MAEYLKNYPDANQRTEFLKSYQHGSQEYKAAIEALYWCLDKLDACLEETKTQLGIPKND